VSTRSLGLFAGAVVFLFGFSGCAGRFHPEPPPGAPEGSKFVEADGVKVRYRAVGSGPAVLLLHGYGSSLEIWGPVADALAKKHRVIAIDLKGFGFTGRPAGDYSPSAQARMAWAVLDKLGVKDVAIVGHSWGASVVLAMALAEPKRVRRIALYSAYVFEDQVPSFMRWARQPWVGEAIFGLYYREGIEARIGLAYYDQKYVTYARVKRVEGEFNRTGAVAAALATARGQRYSKVEKRYPSIDKPVLLLWGKNDHITPHRFGVRLARTLPNARLVSYGRCGHLPMVEAAHATTRELAGFLAKDVTLVKEPAPAAPAPTAPEGEGGE
jgi:pimeloyl-ACP methyl ester carboxylesterase